MTKSNVSFSSRNSQLEPSLEGFNDLVSTTNSLIPSSPAESFYNKGARALLEGDKIGLRYFDLALRLTPYDPHLYFEQGLCLLEFGSESQDKAILLLAQRRLKQALELDPKNFAASIAMGQTLYELGLMLSDYSFFQKGQRLCENLVKAGMNEELKPEFYTLFGSILMKVAQRSGEPADFFHACSAFEYVTKISKKPELSVWEQLIEGYLAIFEVSNDLQLLTKVINACQKALVIHPDAGSIYALLADAVSKQYFFSHQEEHGAHATRFFLKSIQLSPLNLSGYMAAMHHLLLSFSIDGEISHLSHVETLYTKAALLMDPSASLCALFCRAKALMGYEKGELSMVRNAARLLEEIIDQRALEKESFILCEQTLGICCFLEGKYFQDCDFYYQGIEHFQAALSANRAKPELWLWMATSYKEAFKLCLDEVDFNNSVKFYKKVLCMQMSSSTLFEYAQLLLSCFETFHEEPILQKATSYFAKAIEMQPNARYVHPNWLFEYAKALDLRSDFEESEESLVLSIKMLKEVYALDANFPGLFHQLGLSVQHLATFILDQKLMQSALHYFKLAHIKDKENDQILLDWGSALMNLAEIVEGEEQELPLLEQAHHKVSQAITLGNTQGFYLLACLYAYQEKLELALFYLKRAYQNESLPSMKELEEEAFLKPLLRCEEMAGFLEQISWKNPE